MLTDVNTNTFKYFICGVRSETTFHLVLEWITCMYSSLPHEVRLLSPPNVSNEMPLRSGFILIALLAYSRPADFSYPHRT